MPETSSPACEQRSVACADEASLTVPMPASRAEAVREEELLPPGPCSRRRCGGAGPRPRRADQRGHPLPWLDQDALHPGATGAGSSPAPRRSPSRRAESSTCTDGAGRGWPWSLGTTSLQPDRDLLLDRPTQGPHAPRFSHLTAVKDRLVRFQTHYEATASPFQWTFTRRELYRLLARLPRRPRAWPRDPWP